MHLLLYRELIAIRHHVITVVRKKKLAGTYLCRRRGEVADVRLVSVDPRRAWRSRTDGAQIAHMVSNAAGFQVRLFERPISSRMILRFADFMPQVPRQGVAHNILLLTNAFHHQEMASTTYDSVEGAH